MPEIKNNFTQGKMNKDLDERLVPNGQYRDAMNVQISTSDSSDVGAIENVLGNKLLMSGNEIGDSAYCVGAVVDEKNDALYWLVSGSVYLGLNEEISRDMILQYKDGKVTPVVVDIYRIRTLYANHDATANTVVVGFNDPNKDFIEVGMVVQFDDSFNQVCYFGNNPITNITPDPSGNLIITLQNNFNVPPLSPQSSSTSSFIFSKGSYSNCDSSPSNVTRTLNFHRDNLVTGLNVLDGFLIFTDNHSEPKKINIQRCIDGSNGFDKNTRLVVPQNNITINDNILLQEHHVTAIKKSPLTPLIVNPQYDTPIELIAGPGPFGYGTPQIDFASGTGDLAQPGDIMEIALQYLVWQYGNNLQNGEEIRFLSGGSSGSLPNDFEVRAKIVAGMGGAAQYVAGLTNVPYNLIGASTGDAYRIEIISISGATEATRKSYDVMRPVVEDLLFEKKFPRFSYRWKYRDGEYSTFAPFTNVVFSPGEFNYSSTSPFNTAMQSLLVSIELRDFLPFETPKDVVEVDLLYKESNSPIVYVVDKIKKSDYGTITVNGVSNLNSWDANQYALTSDLIYAALPSNQLLRPWDNLPRKALAQEITGNRVVYANYLQNYNLDKPILESGRESRYPKIRYNNARYNLRHSFNGNDTRQPVVNVDTVVATSGALGSYLGYESLKSLREYQVGITFMDEYGRETPVFSNPESTFNLPKKSSASKVKITTELKTPPPSWASYFKFYVKETANEYYNLAMDRWYAGEDGTIWLSFPSSERNKVDEETFIILKKQADTNVYIKQKAKYKILAIKNEAPDYIKSRTTIAGASSGSDTPTLLSTSQPVIGQRHFEIDEDTWVNNGGGKLNELVNSELSLRFEAGNVYSKKYDITSLNVYTDQGVTGGSVYRVVLDRPIENADQDLLYPNFPTVSSNNLPDFKSNLSLKVYKRTITQDPEFEGKFFVKINSDGITDQYITTSNSDAEYEILARANAYYLLDADIGGQGATNYFGNNASGENTTGVNKSDTKAKWEDNLDFNDPQDGEVDSEWFIDQCYYNSGYPTVSTEPGGGGAVGASMNPNFPGGWGQGIYTDNSGQVYMELAYSAVEPRIGASEIPFEDIPGGKKKTYSDFNENYIWDVGKGTNPDNAAEATIVDQIVEGSKFRFTSDTNETIYTITGPVQIERRLNHTSWNQVEDAWQQWNNANFNLNSSWSNSTYTGYRDKWRDFGRANNRRVTYIIPIDKDPVTQSSPNPVGQAWGSTNQGADDSTPVGIEFITPRKSDDSKLTITKNPAIWETEPKENIDLDIYHEASQAYPINFNGINNNLYAPVGSILSCPANNSVLYDKHPPYLPSTYIVRWNSPNEVVLNQSLNTDLTTGTVNMAPGETFVFNRADESYVSLKLDNVQVNTPSIAPQPVSTSPGHFYLEETTYKITHNIVNSKFALSWFNCYSFGNGVESNRIRDSFNEVTIDKGPVVSAVLDAVYEEERRSSGLIYSGIYNTNSGVNNLNQFIQAEKITKDLNPTYGSIQKLFSRNTDLISFCEDKVIRISANKDAIFNADGNPQLIASNRVLGQTLPFSGDYGISKNPESFAVDNYRAYFTDKQRSAVLRLSKDGLTAISEYGMSDWFGDNLQNYPKLVGSFDADKGDYNLTLREANVIYNNEPKTLTYNENVKGWVSFKSFTPEQGISISNNYYTFKNGYLYVHHNESVDRNTFYGDLTFSSIDVLLNTEPSSIKNYQTLNYEGSKSKITMEFVPPSIFSNEFEGYDRLVSKEGWFVESIVTNKQQGHINEFIEKEGKWFNYIKGNTLTTNADIKTSEFSFQGIGRAASVPPPTYGCTDSTALNYDPLANVDDGSCTYPVSGCTDPLANNYDPLAVIDDGSCTFDPTYNCDYVSQTGGIITVYDGTGTYTDPVVAANNCPTCNGTPGCTDPNFVEYDPLAICDDGSCTTAVVAGCTTAGVISISPTGLVAGAPFFPDIYGNCITPGIVPGSSGKCDPNDGYVVCNYDPLATVDDGSCIAPYFGCTDNTANNYDPCASFLQGCTYDVYGCTDPTMFNYDPLATIDDGTCTPIVLGCIDPSAVNYDATANTDDGSCCFVSGCTDPTMSNYDPLACFDDGSCIQNDKDWALIDPCLGCQDYGEAYLIANYPFVAMFSSEHLCAAFQYNFGAWGMYDQEYQDLAEYLDPCPPEDCTVLILNGVPQPLPPPCQPGGIHYPCNTIPNPNYLQWFNVPGTPFAGPSGNGTNYYTQTTNPDGSYTYNFSVCDEIVNDPLPSGTIPSNVNPGTFLQSNSTHAPCNVTYGCTDPNAQNYDPTAQCDDASCIPFVNGCTDPNALNWYPGANVDDGSCIYAGCTNPAADNYDPLATIDDGTCCSSDPSTGLPSC